MSVQSVSAGLRKIATRKFWLPGRRAWSSILFAGLLALAIVFAANAAPNLERIFAATASIAYDNPVSGTITSPAETDEYTFSAGKNDQVLIRMVVTSGSLDPQFRLFRPNGTQACSEQSFGQFLETACNIDTTGVHKILVNAWMGNGSGSYYLYIQRTNKPVNTAAMPFDDTQFGTISPAIDLNAHTFVEVPPPPPPPSGSHKVYLPFAVGGGGGSGPFQDSVLVRMKVTSGSLDPQFRVYRPGGTLLCQNQTFGEFIESLCAIDRSGGHGTLVGAWSANNTGSYELYVQSTRYPANTTPIPYDVTQSGILDSAVDLNAYTFDGDLGDEVLFRLKTTAGSIDPQFRVYRPNGTLLCDNQTFGEFIESQCTIDTAGTHTILVGAWSANASGSYDLYIERTNNPANTTAITFDETKSDTISPAVEMDALTFGGAVGDQVLFRLKATSGTIDPQFRVYRPNGTLLCDNQTFGVFIESQCTIDTAGTHTILVAAWSANASGSFDLYIERTNNPANTTAITFDETKSDTISPALEMDAFTFSGTVSDQVLFRLHATSGSIDPEFRVYRPNGTLLCDNQTFGTFIESQCTIDTAGTHTILVAAWSANASGSFDLYIQRTNNPANPTAVAFDEIKSDTVSPAVEMDAFTFSGTVSDQVLFRLHATSGTIDPEFRVYRPNGTLLCDNQTFGTFIESQCTIDTDGTHTILVAAWSANASGSFDLYIQRTNDSANPTAIIFDQTRSDTISPAVEMDAFTFSGTVSDQVLLRLNATSGSIDPEFRVYRPNGTLLCDNQTFGAFVESQCTIDTAGTHTILVAAWSANASGSFDLYIQRTNNPANPTAIAYGETKSDTVSPAVEMDGFTFSGSVNDQVLFRMDVTSGSIDPEFRVYRPNGTLLCNAQSFGTFAETQCAIDTDGTHAILVAAWSANAAGSYDLHLQLQ